MTDVEYLVSLLVSEHMLTREQASYALRGMSPVGSQFLAQLVSALTDKSPDVRANVVHIIGRLGAAAEPAILPLIDRLQDTYFTVRRNAARALGEIQLQAPDVVPALAAVLERDPDWDVRTEAATALGQFGPEAAKALPTLINALQKDGDWLVRAIVAKTLGMIASDASLVTAALEESLYDKNGLVQMCAAQALEAIQAAKKTTTFPPNNASQDPGELVEELPRCLTQAQ